MVWTTQWAPFVQNVFTLEPTMRQHTSWILQQAWQPDLFLGPNVFLPPPPPLNMAPPLFAAPNAFWGPPPPPPPPPPMYNYFPYAAQRVDCYMNPIAHVAAEPIANHNFVGANHQPMGVAGLRVIY